MSYFNNKKGMPSYYSSPDADSYTYVDGRGFAPTPPVITERRMLQWCANGIGFAIFHWGNPYVVAGGIFMGALTIFQHRSNIVRLMKGQERKTNLLSKGKKV